MTEEKKSYMREYVRKNRDKLVSQARDRYSKFLTAPDGRCSVQSILEDSMTIKLTEYETLHSVENGPDGSLVAVIRVTEGFIAETSCDPEKKYLWGLWVVPATKPQRYWHTTGYSYRLQSFTN